MSDKDLVIHPYYKHVAYYNYKGMQQPVFYYPEGIDIKALHQAYNQLDNLFTYHSRITIVLIQFHQTTQLPHNKHLSKFIARLKTLCIKHYKIRGDRFGYAWAREEGKDGTNQHYHIAIMIDGHVCQKSYQITQLAKQACKDISPFYYIYAPKRNLFKVKRTGSGRILRAARMRASYAYKYASKEKVPVGVRRFGCSSIKPKSSLSHL
ncbi:MULTISPECIES: inovirus Gp2 family protein [Vibrio]|uniref:inovirus Gp2 family protein n=1 Tax=Vibrio TaxID=662 RepID=UPI00215BE87E|nr:MULTISPECIES: inovirus Gp2 family protein [Vibrio]MDF4384634.1 inovirus Gp2 family protein [Vibrio parahaemolyticus]MCR9641874.1 inovirus Gp2 family protein [Vibrio alginolyticus]MDW2055594.1 inovirus Gp2 family protein [Vibrio sp. 506]MDW2096992.1 inovirus Gp2 family protein [Vibrio sp. 1751]MDW2243820.1 inovirus Gp2 family protein [Vibrio sp. 1287]